MEKAVYYFSHPVDLRDDIRMKGVRRRHGRDGYSFCVIMFEILAGNDGFEQELDDDFMLLLEEDYDFEESFVNKVLSSNPKVFSVKKDKGVKVVRSDFLEDELLDRVLSQRQRVRKGRSGKSKKKDSPSKKKTPEQRDETFKVPEEPDVDSNWRDKKQ